MQGREQKAPRFPYKSKGIYKEVVTIPSYSEAKFQRLTEIKNGEQLSLGETESKYLTSPC